MDGINGGLNRQDGIPLDEAWLTLETDGGVMNVPGEGGRSWEGTNNLAMGTSGAYEGAHLINNFFSLTSDINAEGRTVEMQNAGRYMKMSLGIGASFFPISPVDSDQMLRVNVNPLTPVLVTGKEVTSNAFSHMDTSDWVSINWRPSVSATWMDTKRGVGVLLKLSADAFSAGAYNRMEPVKEDKGTETGEVAQEVSKEFRRVGVTPKAEVFYAPWLGGPDRWYRGLMFHAGYEHNVHEYNYKDFDERGDLKTTVNWGQILAGARLSFGGGGNDRATAIFNMQ